MKKTNIKINSFRICDYKSIYDSGEIMLQDRITVFAGKNESGKTNILKALETFFKDNFSDEDVPTGKQDSNPTIIINFSILGKYFNEKIDSEWLKEDEEYTYTITRSKNIRDKFEGRLINEINKNIIEEVEKILDNVFLEIEKVDNYKEKKMLCKVIGESIQNYILSGEELEVELSKKIKSIIGTPEGIENCVSNILNIVNNMECVKKLENLNEIIIPKFLYFDSFNDMLPDEISISEIDKENFEIKNKGFINLLNVFGKNLSEFKKEMAERNRTPQVKLNAYSEKITLDYKEIYTQEELNITLNKDGDNVFINIYDIDDSINPKKPSQRSKGLQWFLSFYLMLNNSDEDTILLIDEPGLYLHASAQEDILNFFENKLDNTILYTTHSPYLIDTNNMLRIKLVTNNRNKKKGTNVENKYYNCSDIDTITPIITAIGYNVAKSPLELGSGLNIIVEGVSDRYYLLGFLKLIKNKDRINIIPAQGATTIHLLVSMAIGWNLNYKILLDTDGEQSKAKEQLKNFYSNDEELDEHICDVIESKNMSIENIFSKEDMKKHKISKKNKVINSKRFYDSVVEGNIKIEDLEEETIQNINSLLNRLISN